MDFWEGMAALEAPMEGAAATVATVARAAAMAQAALGLE